MTELFFYNDPSVLWKYPTKLYFTIDMSYNEKLNVIIRIVIILSLFGFLLTKSIKYILIGCITTILIIILYQYRNGNSNKKEGMENIMKLTPKELNPKTFENLMKKDYYPITPQNPLGNVLLTDYQDNPNKKPAQPSFNGQVAESITKNIKKSVQKMNPTITNTTKQLYGNLWDEFELDNSNRNFISNANTKITNDQGAFVKFLYGDLPSGKDGSKNDLLANSSRYLLI